MYVWQMGYQSSYRDTLMIGQSGVRSQAGSRLSVPIQTSPGAHQASCTMGGKAARMTLTTHPHLRPKLKTVEL